MPALHTESENKDQRLTSLYINLNLINTFLRFFFVYHLYFLASSHGM